MAAPTLTIRGNIIDYRYPPVNTLAETLAWLDEMRAVLSSNTESILLHDLPRGYRITAEQRQAIAHWMDVNLELGKTRCIYTAFVMPSAAERGILTAIFWFSGLPHDYCVVASREEAERRIEGFRASRAGARG
jgi:hypothetical protein